MEYATVIERLKSLSVPENLQGMARFGINPHNTLGVSTPNLRRLAKETRTYCKIGPRSDDLLRTAITKLGLSARAYDRILKVSRTVADLAGLADIRPEHVGEAIQYRTLDWNLWM